MRTFTINDHIELTEEDIADIIIDSLETSITYWACLHNDTDEFKYYYEMNKDIATSEIAANIILNGGSVEITDVEEDVEPNCGLDLDGLVYAINEYDKEFGFCINDYDAETCDWIIQKAIFDDIIFG